MMAVTVETAGGRQSDAEGLRESPTNASGKTASGRIMAQDRPDATLSEPEKCLPISKIAIESPGSPAMVPPWRIFDVGASSFGKSRLMGHL